MNNYSDACTEVYIILGFLNKEEYKKIPMEVIKAIEKNINPKYNYRLDNNLDLKNQEMLVETKAILLNLFRDYLCTEEQREIIKRQQFEERQKNEIRKQMIYNSNDMFNKIDKEKKLIQEKSSNTEFPIVEYKERFFIKIIKKMKEWLKMM